MPYPLVEIHNSTKFKVVGEVLYCSKFCSDDRFKVDGWSSWKANHRGVCLVTRITAKVDTARGVIDASPYVSNFGTSYSQFAIVQTGENRFAVTRIVDGMEDSAPQDYMEPTEMQK